MNDDKDSAAVKFFPPGIPVIAICLGFLLEWFVPIFTFFPIDAPLRIVLGIILVVGSIFFLGFLSVVLFRKGGQSENPWKPTTHIEEGGPYKFTRNPMYLQMVLVCVGVAIASANIWLLILVPCVITALHFLVIQHEEAYLETKFGDSYLSYKKRVRRWI